LIPALAARLGRMAGVYRHNFQSSFLRFVLDETAHLCKRPAVHPAALLPVTLLSATADFGQVLKHKGSTGSNTTNETFGQNVVTIAPKP
jgi:hypothetical protein